MQHIHLTADHPVCDIYGTCNKLPGEELFKKGCFKLRRWPVHCFALTYKIDWVLTHCLPLGHYDSDFLGKVLFSYLRKLYILHMDTMCKYTFKFHQTFGAFNVYQHWAETESSTHTPLTHTHALTHTHTPNQWSRCVSVTVLGYFWEEIASTVLQTLREFTFATNAIWKFPCI